ncbi:hypothetical protein JTE90_014919 [Oedothorax gibbosus]|uniref:Uncharacterized protein n=1 Tax=Oedothorax gibbosus TaxID=931172 RepID=A0AAV6VLG9_9ARAC|nr:hypothetical protein JTE90_014919 [Oedothorax gibbosus]
MNPPTPDKPKDDSKKPADSSGQDPSGGGIQQAFDAYVKLGGGKDGKIKSDSVQQWIKKAGIPGVSDDDCKKHFGKDGGLDLNEFKQGVEKLAKDKKQEKEDILKKLSSALPSGGAMGGMMEEAKDKLGGEKK